MNATLHTEPDTPSREGPVVYRIDAADRLTCVNDAWEAFACVNHGSKLLPGEVVVGRSIWNFISGAEVIEIYRMLFDRVRNTGRPVRIPYRCDSPDMRRYMELEIEPLRNAGLSVTSRTLRVQPRPPVELLEAASRDPNHFLTVCSWCKRLRAHATLWLEVEDATRELGLAATDKLPRLSHGICPDCERMTRDAAGI